MALKRAGRLALAFFGALAVAACEEGASPFGGTQSGDLPANAPGQTRLVDRDVEAPEVFQVTADGLWDGRPSLGGVWVAFRDVQDPERVIIRNEANGKFVIGALFRREREAPGPPFQVSSDAAEALGMLAGAPASLNVTALRKQEVPIADETPAAAEDAPAIEEIALEAIEGAEAASAAPPAPAPAPSASTSAPASSAASVPAGPPQQTSSLEEPYIQIGLFSVHQNAENTGQALRTQGIVPIIEKQTSRGKTYWRVIVGPSATTGERAQLLRKVKDLGFNDAYFVKR